MTCSQALERHLEAARSGTAEADQAVEAALHSLLTLKSAPAGVLAILDEDNCLRRLCRVLDMSLSEAAKLVLDMLLHILVFSSLGYAYVVKVLLQAVTFAVPMSRADSSKLLLVSKAPWHAQLVHVSDSIEKSKAAS